MAKTSVAQVRAHVKYRKKAYDEIGIMIRKDSIINAAFLKEFARQNNISVNALIKKALAERIMNDDEFVV